MPTALNIFNFKLFIQYEHRTHTQCTHEPNEKEEEEHKEANNERETKKNWFNLFSQTNTHIFIRTCTCGLCASAIMGVRKWKCRK